MEVVEVTRQGCVLFGLTRIELAQLRLAQLDWEFFVTRHMLRIEAVSGEFQEYLQSDLPSIMTLDHSLAG